MGYSVFTHGGSQVDVATPSRFIRGLEGGAARSALASSAVALSVVLPVSALAQTACPPEPGEICALRGLQTDFSGGDGAFDVSDDSQVIVGQSTANNGFTTATRWSSQGRDVGTLTETPFFNISRALATNQDGSVVVGEMFEDTPKAFRWTETTGMVDLGTLRSDNLGRSIATGVNADGSVVVGNASSENGTEAFRWVSGFGMENLSVDPVASFSMAMDVDGSGQIVVGVGSFGTEQQPVRWTVNEGLVALVGPESIASVGSANAISSDGSTIVGSMIGLVQFPALWRDESIESVSLDLLDGLNANDTPGGAATSVNADGSVVVGWSDSGEGVRATRWVEGEDVQNLGVLDGDESSVAQGVSGDGSLVVGQSQGQSVGSFGIRAFIWRDDTMLDHLNAATTVQQSAQSLAATAAHYGQNTVYQLGREVALRGPGAGQDGPVVSTQGEATPQPAVAVRVGGRLAYNDDVASSAGADVSAAVGLTPTLTLGGFVEIMGESDSHSVVSLDGTHISGGASLRYRASPDGTGLTWRVAAVAGGGDFDVTRQDVLPNTERGEGATSLTTLGLSAEVGYGIETARGTVTPFARLTGSWVERDGFTETNAIAFPLNYDEYEEEALTLTLGADARFDVSDVGTLRLDAGVSYDLDRSDDPVTGTSAIPGFTNFSVDGPELENRTRGYVSAGYSHALGGGRAVSGSVSVAQSPWTDDLSFGARVGYEMRF